MKIKKLTLNTPGYPVALSHIPSAPKVLYHAGADLNELLKHKAVAVVGTRTISIYGEQVTQEFSQELAEQGVVIISGLALGVDGLAHQSALEVGGLCIAVLPCPLNKIVPATHERLAQQILDGGGALVSEYASGELPFKQNFIARNRIMSGLADAVLITEAGEKSGAIYTANFASDQDKDVLAIPGNITNIGSIGINTLIKNHKAQAVTSSQDVLNAIGLENHKTKAREVRGSNQNEQKILDFMLQGVTDADRLLELSDFDVSIFNQVLAMLEIRGKIRPLGMNHWTIF